MNAAEPSSIVVRTRTTGRAGRDIRLVPELTSRWHHRLTLLARLLLVVTLAALAAMPLRAYVIMPYYIPSASMEPTLHGCQGCNNDRVLVDKLAYHLHDVHRGDVVVFDRPVDLAQHQRAHTDQAGHRAARRNADRAAAAPSTSTGSGSPSRT